MIYIVEDDTGVRELELYALKQAGFEVEGFSNAAAFRAAIKKALPSLVLLDVMLPGEDGVTLLQSLRREPRTKRLPIILVTAKGTEMDKVRGLDAGADDYLSKPFGVMELAGACQGAAAQKRRTADRNSADRRQPDARPRAAPGERGRRRRGADTYGV